MKRAILLMAFLLSPGDFASAQSLPETAAYILTGGTVDVGDMKEVDQDTTVVTMPIPSNPLLGMIGAPANLNVSFIVKVIDREQCIIQAIPDPDQKIIPDNIIKALPDFVYYLNNIIVDETTYQTLGAGTKLVFSGEEFVLCNFTSVFLNAPRYFGDPLANERGPKNNKQCSRSLPMGPIENDKIQRFLKAVQYLYANFCTPAKRKGAF
jgi:hypothetical protein